MITNHLRNATNEEVLAALPHVWEGDSGRKYPANVTKVKLSLEFTSNTVTAFVYTDDRITAHGHIVWNWGTESVRYHEIRAHY
jgi:uncharacterized protein YukE